DVKDAIGPCLSDSNISAKARAAAYSGRLVKIWSDPRIYVYMGDHGDHVIVDGVYCSCEAFIYSVLRGGNPCYHVLAARMPGARVREVKVDVNDAWNIVYEVLSTGFSPTLRRLLYSAEALEDPGDS
ncbi:MAG: SWIM zinc finger family protein, partial [Desulfurococcales archaeon]|nr:SWIM zinc finger family protein [Desulfurococcales archaeon]